MLLFFKSKLHIFSTELIISGRPVGHVGGGNFNRLIMINFFLWLEGEQGE